jgi:hypothetical protein
LGSRLRPAARNDALRRRGETYEHGIDGSSANAGGGEPKAEALAQRLEAGARALAAFAGTLSDAEWRMPFGATDERTIGVIVHHVASIYPLEIQLAQVLASGQANHRRDVGRSRPGERAPRQRERRATKDAALELLHATARRLRLPYAR